VGLWDSGILGIWDSEILGFGDSGIMGFWSSGIMGYLDQRGGMGANGEDCDCPPGDSFGICH